MFEILKTPKYGLSFLMLTFFVYITAPIFEWLYLTNLLASGNLPQNADSIGLPFGLFVIVWIFFAPFVLCFVLWTLQKYPSQASLFGFNQNHQLWSFVWSLIFGFLIFDCLALTFVNFSERYFIGAIQHLLLAYIFMIFRASNIFRKGEC